MKLRNKIRIRRQLDVTPCVGVWIEIDLLWGRSRMDLVTPCVGVWIEIRLLLLVRRFTRCHSLRGSVD